MRNKLQYAAARALLLLLPLFAAPSLWAQSAGTKPIYAVEFKPGAKTATVEGRVGPPAGEGDMYDPGSERYSLQLRAGQSLKLLISSDTEQAVFTLTAPDDEIVKGAGRVKRWSGKLATAGSYIITVFTTGDAAKFKLRITLR